MSQKMESPHLLRLVALTGIIGPFLFAGMLTLLTVLQYDFMRSLRWHPLMPIDWPSGLALGPYGIWMNVAFAGTGLVLMLFAWGLAQLFPKSIPPFLFFVSGLAMLMLCFPTDPTYRTTPMTINGILHDAAYVILGISFIPGMMLLTRHFARIPEWKIYARLTWWAVVIIIPSFIIKGVAFYILLLAMLTWYELISLKIWQVASGSK
jgi:hypothetical protein